jgi:hypothetical protein
MAGVLNMVVASDLANQLLKDYVRSGALAQTTQDKPLLRILTEKGKTFTGGLSSISLPVQGAFMSDTAGFFQGYSEDDALVFTQGQNVIRAEYNWYEHHAGLEISWTELKKDGITVADSGDPQEHPDAASVRITTGVLKSRIEDFGESWARSKNYTLWKDGSQDPKAVPGLKALLPDNYNTGTTGGLSRATYPWWRHRCFVGANKVAADPANQTLTKHLRADLRQLRRWGGKPDILLAGSGFIEKLESEVFEKGIYTQEGFANEGKTDIGMAKIKMKGLGSFEYDPTLDDIGESNRCYIIDSRRIQLRPMKNEENKVLHPERPYNVAVYLQSMTTTLALVANQLNCHEVIETA